MLSDNIKSWLLVMALCVPCSQAFANEAKNGFDSARNGDYAGALKFWQQKADQGDAQAQFNLALMYHGGLGVDINEPVALEWYQKAAANGYPWAQEYLAIAYQEGWFGLKQDLKKSAVWFKRLEEHGYF